MSVWTPETIEEEPEVILSSWAVFELPSGDRHFCGYNVLLREGRVSSAIKEFDSLNMRGRTRSGRIYSLQGSCGYDGDARYVWSSWCRINAVDPALVKNVSQEFGQNAAS